MNREKERERERERMAWRQWIGGEEAGPLAKYTKTQTKTQTKEEEEEEEERCGKKYKKKFIIKFKEGTSKDESKLYEYVLSPFATYVVETMMPTSVSPNALTIMGLVCTTTGFIVGKWRGKL